MKNNNLQIGVLIPSLEIIIFAKRVLAITAKKSENNPYEI